MLDVHFVEVARYSTVVGSDAIADGGTDVITYVITDGSSA